MLCPRELDGISPLHLRPIGRTCTTRRWLEPLPVNVGQKASGTFSSGRSSLTERTWLLSASRNFARDRISDGNSQNWAQPHSNTTLFSLPLVQRKGNVFWSHLLMGWRIEQWNGYVPIAFLCLPHCLHQNFTVIGNDEFWTWSRYSRQIDSWSVWSVLSV